MTLESNAEQLALMAPIGPVEQLPVVCGLCGTPYTHDECPTCAAEREDAERVIERRLRRDTEEKDRLIRDVEEWLEDRNGL